MSRTMIATLLMDKDAASPEPLLTSQQPTTDALGTGSSWTDLTGATTWQHYACARNVIRLLIWAVDDVTYTWRVPAHTH